ncbi:MAG: iron ABC transporter permease [Fibrobacteraceae bacterium]|nr:iron ABC transporter permease [Fibrobacteraceae bacterium]
MRLRIGLLCLSFLLLLLIVFSLLWGPTGFGWSSVFGSASSPVAQHIFYHIRLPKTVAAVLSGAALSVSGLALQTLFRNPLCGPFVLGISSGASLGVALSLLAGLTFGCFGVLSSAAIGALVVTIFVMYVSSKFERASVLLIVGLLTGYFVDGFVSLLIASSSAESLKVYVSWGMGSFGRLTFEQMGIFSVAVAVGLLLIAVSIRYLNAAGLGDEFAKNLGINVGLYKRMVILGASILAAAATSFCGPVAFVGIAVPHLAYALTQSSNYRVLLPATLLCGSSLCLLAGLFTTLPLNALLSIVGVPMILWVLIRSSRNWRL